ncbi:putative transcription factor C2H2 family [Helianthus annuus]|nr:putative transcription factor C2H2 family [Helianthus annuus]
MGHQHHFSPSFMLEADNEQSWNFAENTYMPTARNGAGPSSSSIYHTDNMSIDGPQYTHCNHTPTSNAYPSLPHNLPIPNYQQDVAGPSDLSMLTLHTPSTYIAPEDYRNRASSSNYSGNPFNEEDLFDLRVSNQSVQYKRKSPGVPEGQSGQSSSDVAMIDEPWTNFLHAPLDFNMTNANALSIGGGSSVRNVRSRSTIDLEASAARNHLTSNLARDFYTTSRPMDIGPSLNGLSPTRVSSTVNENGTLNYEQLNPFLEQSSSNTSSSVVSGQQNNNHVLRTFPSSFAQSVRGVRSGFSQSQRPASTFRVSSTNLTDDRLHLATNNHSSRRPRPSSSIGWHTSDRRYRSLSRVNFHDHPPSEGVMIMDRSAVYGSRNPFDQHRDMRLDIDDMSYEELLALGERIGSVGTGLPDHLISKCIQESIYCSSDQIQDEGTCVICLEEYANMDDVGMLRVCGHDFHVGCIRKWLSMKNLCPICKAEPMKQK